MMRRAMDKAHPHQSRRAVNPVDEDGQAFEDPVRVIEADISYDLSARSSTR